MDKWSDARESIVTRKEKAVSAHWIGDKVGPDAACTLWRTGKPLDPVGYRWKSNPLLPARTVVFMFAFREAYRLIRLQNSEHDFGICV